MDLKEIRALIDLMKKNGVAVFKMEREGFKITLKTGECPAHVVTSGPPAVSLPISAAEAAVQVPASEPGSEIKSPMVGTFYDSPSPDTPPFVAVGQQVTAETVVCIIEAMKVMNEIKADVSGTVAEVCAENGKPVQFGQALFRLK